MKNQMILLFSFFTLLGFSQENMVSFSGGYVFANVENVDESATGWRINGTYEYRPNSSSFAHGISVGYIATTAEIDNSLGDTNKFKINSIPVYYAPKYLFGDGSFEGFVKGALGMQFSNLERTGSLVVVSDNDSGFYGGLGLGGMKTFKEKYFINLEYEWAYMSNSFYKDGFVNSLMLGLGVRF